MLKLAMMKMLTLTKRKRRKKGKEKKRKIRTLYYISYCGSSVVIDNVVYDAVLVVLNKLN